jgi:hypothetical protein
VPYESHPEPRQPTLVRRWPDPERGPYRLAIWIAEIGGRPAIAGVEVWGVLPDAGSWINRLGLGSGPEVGITAEAIRLPLGRMLQGHLGHGHALAKAARRLGADRAAVDAYEARLSPPKRGRPRLDDTLLRLVAAEYAEAVARGRADPAKVARARVSSAQRREVPPGTVRRWIAEARKRGHLTIPPTPRQPRAKAATTTKRRPRR